MSNVRGFQSGFQLRDAVRSHGVAATPTAPRALMGHTDARMTLGDYARRLRLGPREGAGTGRGR